MARRFLLIEFDDAAQADTLRAQIDNATRSGKKYRVVGLFARPGNQFCQCKVWTSKRGHDSPTKRGARFGWWVCVTCKKPVPAMAGLKNLVEPSEIIDPPLTEDGLAFYTYTLSADTTRTLEMNPHYGMAK